MSQKINQSWPIVLNVQALKHLIAQPIDEYTIKRIIVELEYALGKIHLLDEQVSNVTSTPQNTSARS